MRIIGGHKKGINLAPIGDVDLEARLRPTSDRVRESIFNLLENGRYKLNMSKTRVLDLFAGTGAMSFEAASRGAEAVTMIENGPKSLTLIGQNMEITGLHLQVYNADATQLPACPNPPFDLVFIDPPYGKQMGHAALLGLKMGWLMDDARIVWEEGAEFYPPEGYSLLEVRRYGDTFIHFLRVSSFEE